MDYTIFYKEKFEDTTELSVVHYDLFISSYNSSFRVNTVFENINSLRKHWIILPEYNYTQDELPTLKASEKLFQYVAGQDESEVIRAYFNENNALFNTGQSVCIDITGFLRPHLIFLIRFLALKRIPKVNIIYSDPETYVKKEKTNFSDSFLTVKQLTGCQGNHNPKTDNDLLIIGSGYDDKRISDVAINKANAKKIQVFGFPSLQPDMFQENIIRAYKAEESSMVGDLSFIDSNHSIFAPANDPFITAQMISDYVKKEESNKKFTNIYLSPLSTKAQALGFILFYVYECLDKPVSIIFPYYAKYTRETSKGITKIWLYTIEYPS